MSLQILRPVTVKARVTEDLKARLAAQYREALRLLDEEMKQIESQARQAQLAAAISPQQQMQLRQLVEMERAKREEQKAQLQRELEAVSRLPLGSEIVQDTIQSVVTLSVGDDFEKVMKAEIVVEDGKVIAIREGEG
ncbi:MAG TPA: YlqD family protein [Symbiobacteriaceae bacterium]